MTSEIQTPAASRIQVSFLIPGLPDHQDKRLKTFAYDYMSKRGVGCVIERIRHEDSHSTSVLFEAESGKAYKVQKDLALALKTEFGDITIPKVEDWVVTDSTETLTVAKVSATKPALLRKDSSGEISLVKELQDDAESITSSFKKFVETLTPTRVGYLIQNTRLRAADIHSAVSTTFNKYIHVTYHGVTVCLNVGPCVFFIDFLSLIEEDPMFKGLSGEKIKIYQIVDGDKSYIRDLPALKDDRHYHVETEKEAEVANSPATFDTLDQFYLALEGLYGSDVDKDLFVNLVKGKFKEQGIKLFNLPSLTDIDLRDYGIVQGGLRKAILKVLGRE